MMSNTLYSFRTIALVLVIWGVTSWLLVPAAEALPIDCTTTMDTGYIDGNSYPIELISVDNKPIGYDAGCVFWAMAQDAMADGIELKITSGFRTHSSQTYLYNCHINCNCNNCNDAAPPGYSLHQSGVAIDVSGIGDPCPINTSVATCLQESEIFAWLHENAGGYGFAMTYAPECWHWVYQGGGPMECPCEGCTPACQGNEILNEDCTKGDCGFFGATCATVNGTPDCASPDCVTDTGVAGPSEKFCQGGVAYQCDEVGLLSEVPPPEEVCNGEDDDCDGQIDEGVTNVCGTCGPVPVELCNGVDDNCDGQTDEGYKLDEKCQVGVGICSVSGVLICGPQTIAGTDPGALCSVSPGEPTSEICGNALDDDCDGETDELCPEPDTSIPEPDASGEEEDSSEEESGDEDPWVVQVDDPENTEEGESWAVSAQPAESGEKTGPDSAEAEENTLPLTGNGSSVANGTGFDAEKETGESTGGEAGCHTGRDRPHGGLLVVFALLVALVVRRERLMGRMQPEDGRSQK